MDRVSAPNFTTVGGKRQFQDLNLGSNQSGTELAAVWHNGAQESILAPVEAVGIAPSDADNTQLLQAIKMFAGANAGIVILGANVSLNPLQPGHFFVDATSGSFTVTLPSGATSTDVAIWYRFTRVDGTTNTVTIALDASDHVNPGGMLRSFLLQPFERLAIVGIGHAWQSYTSRRGLQALTSSGTFTPPAGVGIVKTRGWSGGGGGGGAVTGAAGSGGGGGGYFEELVTLTVADIQNGVAVTVGAAGSGGGTLGDGGAGGSSSFGAYCSATGGAGGHHAGTAGGQGTGVAGGAGTGGDINMAGSNSGAATVVSTLYLASGGGAAAAGGGSAGSSTGVGFAGAFPGGGGSGGANGQAGAAGAKGFVVVEW